MKKFLIVFMIISLLIPFAAAETATTYYPFHLQGKETYDDVVNELVTLFGEGEVQSGSSRSGDYVIKPTAKLYGFFIDSISVSKSFTMNNINYYLWQVEIALDIYNVGNEAESIIQIYDNICSIYGDPIGLNPIQYNYDLDGNKEVYFLVKNKSELQRLIDNAKADAILDKTLQYHLYWDNCEMFIYSSKYGTSVYLKWTKYADSDYREYMYYMIK